MKLYTVSIFLGLLSSIVVCYAAYVGDLQLQVLGWISLYIGTEYEVLTLKRKLKAAMKPLKASYSKR